MTWTKRYISKDIKSYTLMNIPSSSKFVSLTCRQGKPRTVLACRIGIARTSCERRGVQTPLTPLGSAHPKVETGYVNQYIKPIHNALITVALMAGAMSVALAIVNFDLQTGTGFMGKGSVQTAFG